MEIIMKKLLTIITLCLLCFCCFFCLTACEDNGETNNTPHTHEYVEMIIEPTCTTAGYTMHICSCKDLYKDNETAALGHNYEWTVTQEPTETANGVETGICTRCNDTITRDILVLAHEHNYLITIIEPTCTEKGYTLHKCDCGEEYRTDETPALGHNYEWTITKQPTETEEGVKTGVCTRCGDTITETFPASNHEHDYIISIVPATCTAGGYTLHKCACGNEYTDNETPALGHNYEWITTKQPTCTEKGEKTATCTRCHETKTEEINAKGHKFTNYVSDGNATFEKDGTKTAYCNYGCGATDTIPDVGSKLAEIEEYFTKQQDGTYYGKVFNKTTTFNFTNKIKGGIEYYVCTDAACTKTLTNNIANLNVGDNVFYVLFADGNKTTATVRRRAICTVNFNSAGGTAVNSQTVEEDRRATAPKSPMRLGYTFNSWDYDFNEPITADTTITAIWNANTNTPFKVEYYLQNLEDDNYTLTDTENLTGTTDTTATATKTYEHFTVVETTASANIEPDGTTVLQVYYTRDKYTLTVQNYNTKGGTITCTKNGTYKYDKEITLSANVNAGYDFDGWYNGYIKISDKLQFVFNISENNNITAKYCAHNDTLYKVEYYLQNLDDDNYTLQENDTEYFTGTTDTTAKATKTYKHFTIVGSTASANIKGDGSTVLQVRYTRDKYVVNISASNSNVELSSTFNGKYKYGYIISEISITLNNHLGYEWRGWYCDNEFMQIDYNMSSFTVDKNINLIANYAVKDEMSNFHFTSTTSTCEITSSKERTVEKVVIPNYVTSIGDYAFYYCESLTSVIIGNSVTSIGNYAFNYCYRLTSVIIGNSVTSIGRGAFDNCRSLTSITIPDGVASIGERTFSFCNSLTNINIPDSVTSIGSMTFYNCSSLTSITIPDSVTSIGEGAFSGCSNLQYNEYDNGFYLGNSNNPYWVLVKAKSTDITSCVINVNIDVIDVYAFSGCSSLTSITIPDNVTSIGSGAFSGCSSLTSIIFNGTMAQWQAISKGNNWIYGVPSNCVLYCTDGDKYIIYLTA